MSTLAFLRERGERLAGDAVRKNRELFEGTGTTQPPDPSLPHPLLGRFSSGGGVSSELRQAWGTSLFSAGTGRMADSGKAPKPGRHLWSVAEDFWPAALLPSVLQIPTGHTCFLLRAQLWGAFRGLFLPPSPGIGKRWLLFTQQAFCKTSPHPAGEPEVPVGIVLAFAYSLLAWGVLVGEQGSAPREGPLQSREPG